MTYQHSSNTRLGGKCDTATEHMFCIVDVLTNKLSQLIEDTVYANAERKSADGRSSKRERPSYCSLVCIHQEA